MKESPKNIAASVRARLLKVAKQTNQDNNAVVNRYAQERFLYRLSISPFRENFILKGALLLLPYHLPVTRPTKDIDFLGKGFRNDPVIIQNIIKQIVSLSAKDGIDFETAMITTESITEQDEYNGVRCKIGGDVDGVTFSIQLDIGFGDDIVPHPNTMDFPVILDFPAPRLNVYSLESAIAEKLEAIVSLNFLTSRMKDFYDILFLSRNHSFNEDLLHQAIVATFNRRGTSIAEADSIFSIEFMNDERLTRQWDAFVQRQNLDRNEKFPTVMKEIKSFLQPILNKKKIK